MSGHPRVDFVPEWERPIRIPEDVPLTHTEPEYAIAGEKGTWRLPFVLGRDVEAGAVLKLQIHARRNNRTRFGTPQTEQPDGDGYLSAATGDGVRLEITGDDVGYESTTFRLAVPDEGLKAGTKVVVALGDASSGGGGIEAPPLRVLNKPFLLYIAKDEQFRLGTWLPEEGECIVAACTMHVLGGPVSQLRAYVPSRARPGEPFDVLVRAEDKVSNLSCQTVDSLVVFADRREVPAEVRRAEGSTCVQARVVLEEEGVFRLKVRDGESGIEALANPVVCRREPPGHEVFWGMIHGHTEMSDGWGTIREYFRQIRDETGLDFAAPGDHDHLHETSDEMWQRTSEETAKWNEPGRFVTLLGYEWAKWRQNGDGDRNVYYLEDYRPMYRSDESNYPAPPDLFRVLKENDEKAIVIPHHTAHAGNWCDWKDHEAERERLVEIFQVRGSYECSEDEGNPLPEKTETESIPVGFVRRALEMGWRVGFTAGGDDHSSHAGTDFPWRFQYKAGTMAVLSTDKTREGIWEAMWNRRVIATSGPRILLDYTLNGRPMGSELDAEDLPELREGRSISIEFHGTAPAERIDIIRNGEVVHSFKKPGLDAELTWEDGAPLEGVLLPPARFCAGPFCFYYVRALQEDGEMAWASPVWIDVKRESRGGESE